jgi:hypothetical protein
MENKSQVAQIRQRIEEEYTAAQQALYAPAMVAKHDFITKRMENVQRAHAELQTIVGTDEAIKLVLETISNLPEMRASHVEPL